MRRKKELFRDNVVSVKDDVVGINFGSLRAPT